MHDLLADRTFRAFDNLSAAPVQGFRDTDDYYLSASCRRFLRNITTPVLITQAIDDPLNCSLSIPCQGELGVGVTLELSRYGGHLDFVGKDTSVLSKDWLDNRIVKYLRLSV